MSRAAQSALLAALVVLAGCAGVPAGDPTTETQTTPTAGTPTDTTASRTTTDDGYYSAYDVRAEQASIDEIAAAIAREPDSFDDERVRAVVVHAATEPQNASRVKLEPRVRLHLNGELVAVNGTYYRIRASVTSREQVTAHSVHAEGPLENRYEGDALAERRERAVNVSELPAIDQRVFNDTIALSDNPYRGLHAIGNWYHFENATVPEASVLAGDDPTIVRKNGTLWTARIDPADTSEQIRYRVTYDATPLAENESAWQEYVRQHHVTAVSNLSVPADSRAVVAEAIDTGSVEWEGTADEEPARFRALFGQGRLQYVAENGTLYRLTVQHIIE
jgi:hypothetical protein